MTLIKFFFTFFVLLGLTSYFFSLFLKFSNVNLMEIKKYSFTFLYLTSSWLLSIAYFGLTSVYFFYLNFPNYYSIYFSFITTIIILIFNYKSFNIFFRYIINYINLLKDINSKEKILLLVLFLVIINSSFRIFINWNDQDEIDVYGYTTKLIYQNWLISDGIFDRFPLIFSEAMSSSFYWVTENNFFPKFIRFISLILLSFSILAICNILNISIFYSIVGSILFFVTPELALIGPSMKVESILIPYELMGLLLFFFAVLSTLKNYNKESMNSLNKSLILNSQDVKVFFLISFIFLVLSFNIRLSGIYSLIISILTLFTLIFLLQATLAKKIKYISILLIIIFFCSPLYIYNFYLYFNPFFPIESAWLKLFPGGQYDKMAFNYEYYKEIGNIVSQFLLIKHLLILPYHSLGLENFSFDFFGLISKPNVAISGWINPITLVFFLAPIFFFRSLEIFVLFTIFFILYLFWVNGIQYSRVFIAASSLNIIIALKIISLPKINFFDAILKLLVKLYILIVLILLFSYQIMWNNNYSGYGYETFFNQDIRHKLTILKSTMPENWKKYKLNKKSFNTEIYNYNATFKHKDINEINKIFNSINKPLIIEEVKDIAFMHLLFDSGFFIDSDKYSSNSNQQNFYKGIITKFLLKNKNVCIIYKEKYNNYFKLNSISFSSLKYHSENDIYVKCVK